MARRYDIFYAEASDYAEHTNFSTTIEAESANVSPRGFTVEHKTIGVRPLVTWTGEKAWAQGASADIWRAQIWVQVFALFGWEPTANTSIWYVPSGGTAVKLTRKSGNTNTNTTEPTTSNLAAGEWAMWQNAGALYLYVRPESSTISDPDTSGAEFYVVEGDHAPVPGARVKISDPDPSGTAFKLDAHCEVTRSETWTSSGDPKQKLTLKPIVSGADRYQRWASGSPDATFIYSEYDDSGGLLGSHRTAHSYLWESVHSSTSPTIKTFASGSAVTTVGCPSDGASLVIDLTEAPEDEYSYFVFGNGNLTSDHPVTNVSYWLRKRNRFDDPFTGTKYMEGRVSTPPLARGTRTAEAQSEPLSFDPGTNVFAGGLVTLKAGQKYRFDLQFQGEKAGDTVRMHDARLIALRYDADAAVVATHSGSPCDGTAAFQTSTSTTASSYAAISSGIPTSGDHLVVALGVLGTVAGANDWDSIGEAFIGGDSSGSSADATQRVDDPSGSWDNATPGHSLITDDHLFPFGAIGARAFGAAGSEVYKLTVAKGEAGEQDARVGNGVLAILPLTAINASSAATVLDSDGSTTEAGTTPGDYKDMVTSGALSTTSGRRYIEFVSATVFQDNIYFPVAFRPSFGEDGSPTANGIHAPALFGLAGAGSTNRSSAIFLNRITEGSSASGAETKLQGALVNDTETASDELRSQVASFAIVEEAADQSLAHDAQVGLLVEVENAEIVRDWTETSGGSNVWRTPVTAYDVVEVWIDGVKGTQLADDATPSADYEWSNKTDTDKYIYIFLSGAHTTPSADKDPSSNSTVALVRRDFYDRTQRDIDTGSGVYRSYEGRVSRVPGTQTEVIVRSGIADSATSLGALVLANGDGEFDNKFSQRVYEGWTTRVLRLFPELSDNILEAEVLSHSRNGLPSLSPEEFSVSLIDSSASMSQPVAATEETTYYGDFTSSSQYEREITLPYVIGDVLGVPAVRISKVTSGSYSISTPLELGDGFDGSGNVITSDDADWVYYRICANGYADIYDVSAIDGDYALPSGSNYRSVGTTARIPPNVWDGTGTLGTNNFRGVADRPGWDYGDGDEQGSLSASDFGHYNYDQFRGILAVRKSAFWTFGTEDVDVTVAADGGGTTTVTEKRDKYIINQPPDVIFVDVTAGGRDDASGTTTGVAFQSLRTPGMQILHLLRSVAGIPEEDIDRQSLEQLDRGTLRQRLVGHDDTAVASLPAERPPSVGAIIKEGATVLDAISAITSQLFAYLTTNGAGRIRVAVPDLEYGNLVRNGSFNWHEASATNYSDVAESSIYPWVKHGSPTSAEVSTTVAYTGLSAGKVVTPSSAGYYGIKQAIALPGSGTYACTFLIRASSVQGSFTHFASIRSPSGELHSQDVETVTLATADKDWQRVSFTADLDTGSSGPGFLELNFSQRTYSSNFANTVHVDAVELYRVAAVLSDANATVLEVQKDEENYYEAAVSYGNRAQGSPRPSKVVVTDTEAEGLTNAQPLGKYRTPGSTRVDPGEQLHFDAQSAGGVAAALANYYGVEREQMSVEVFGLSRLPSIGDHVMVDGLTRCPERADGYPIWRVAGASYRVENAHAVQLMLVRHGDKVADRRKA